MDEIYKLTLTLKSHQILHVPDGAVFLVAHEQHDTLILWFQCNITETLMPRHIAIYGTGRPMLDSKRKYISTVFSSTGFVWHVYEEDAANAL